MRTSRLPARAEHRKDSARCADTPHTFQPLSGAAFHARRSTVVDQTNTRAVFLVSRRLATPLLARASRSLGTENRFGRQVVRSVREAQQRAFFFRRGSSSPGRLPRKRRR